MNTMSQSNFQMTSSTEAPQPEAASSSGTQSTGETETNDSEISVESTTMTEDSTVDDLKDMNYHRKINPNFATTAASGSDGEVQNTEEMESIQSTEAEDLRAGDFGSSAFATESTTATTAVSNSKEMNTKTSTSADGSDLQKSRRWWQSLNLPWWEQESSEKTDIPAEMESTTSKHSESTESGASSPSYTTKATSQNSEEIETTVGPATPKDGSNSHWWQHFRIPWWWADENVENEKEDVADEIESELELIESELQLTTRRTNSDKPLKLSSDLKVSSPKTPNDSEMVSDILYCGDQITFYTPQQNEETSEENSNLLREDEGGRLLSHTSKDSLLQWLLSEVAKIGLEFYQTSLRTACRTITLFSKITHTVSCILYENQFPEHFQLDNTKETCLIGLLRFLLHAIEFLKQVCEISCLLSS